MGKSARMSENWMPVIEVVAIDESRAVGDESVMVVQHVVSVPIRSPVVPPPAEAGEDADSDSQAERNPWAIDEGARNANPIRIVCEGGPVDGPRIVLRHINDFRVCRSNLD